MNRNFFKYSLIIYLIAMLVAHLMRGGRFPLDNIFGMDKIFHIVEYIIFSFLFINALKSPDIKKVITIIIIGTFYGALIELMQLYVADRFADIYDAMANVIGLLIGSFITYRYLLFTNDKETVH